MLADGLAALTFGRSSWANKKKADIARFGASLSFFCPFFLLGFFTFFGAGFFAFLGFLAFFATGFLAFFAAGFFAFFAAGFFAANYWENGNVIGHPDSHQSSSDPGLVRVRPALGHRFAYNTVRSEQHGGFKLPFSWDEGDGTGEPRLLAGSSEARAPHPPPMRTRGTAVCFNV